MRRYYHVTMIKQEIDMEQEKSLLQDFITGEIENFQDPERRGVRKGEKIGFTKNKSIACLLTGLLNTTPKKLAGEYGKNLFTYALLRKWRSEPEFKTEAENFATEFALRLVQYITDEIYKSNEEFDEYLYGTGDDYSEINIDPIVPNARQLSSAVVACLKGHVNYYINSLEKQPSFSEKIIHSEIIKEIVSLVNYIEGKPPIPVKVGKLELIAISSIVNEVESIIAAKLPEEEFIQVDKLLDLIRGYITDVTNVMED